MFTKIGCLEYDTNDAVCFTGHRPEKLPGNGQLSHSGLRRLLSVLYLAITESIADGKTIFLTGMARGIDIWAAKMIVDIKKQNPKIKLICCIPFRNQGERLSGMDKFDYGCVLEASDAVVVLADTYHSSCYKIRNQYMVEHSSKIIGVICSEKSGTGQTLRYAKKLQREIRQINVNDNSDFFF